MKILISNKELILAVHKLYGKDNVLKIEPVTLHDCQNLIDNSDGSIVYYGSFNKDVKLNITGKWFDYNKNINQSVYFTKLKQVINGLTFTGIKIYLKNSVFELVDSFRFIFYKGVTSDLMINPYYVRLTIYHYINGVYNIIFNGNVYNDTPKLFPKIVYGDLSYTIALGESNLDGIYITTTERYNDNPYNGGDWWVSLQLNL